MAQELTEFDPFAGPAIVASAPTTEPQREIWTASTLGDDASLAFNESIVLRLRGALDVEALKVSFGDLVARHEALRSTISADGLTLVVGATGEVSITPHDHRGFTAEEHARELALLKRLEVETPFDLTRGPLFRVHLVTVAPEEHVIVFTGHHIANDGWSTAVLVKDWAALYNQRKRGAVPELPPAERFSAYATAQASRPESERAPDESYWLAAFNGQVPVLDLPSDRPRPARKTYHSAREDFVLDAELVSDVRRVGAKSRASLFATLLAAFKTLVFRLSGQSDLVIGIPAAGQATGGHDTLVGHCVNMLPLRSHLERGEPFTDLLGRVRTLLLDAMEHQDFTLGKLLTKLPILRDPSRLPLVSVIFNVDRGLTSEAIGFDGLEVELKANPRSFENFDLFLNAVEIDGRIELEAQYNTDLFDAATIHRWLEAYRALLADVRSEPGKALGALEVSTASERALLARWNDTAADFARDACVHELVTAQAARTPDAVACEFEGKSLTYRELDAQSNRVARRLRALGARRGALVGLCLERSLDMLVGLLGIAKSGAGYVPLDPGYPSERLSFMATDAAMPVLVTTSKLRAELALPVTAALCVDELPAATSDDREPLPKDDASATPDSVCYVIYTSGSTGKPKGVLVPHRSVANLLSSVTKRPGLRAEDVVLGITTLSFDIAVSETWLPLTVGAKIVLVSRETAADGALLREVVEGKGVTFIDATPASYRLLIGAGWQGSPRLTLICTGEAMPKDLAVELLKRGGSVWNGYGPTETTVWSTFWQTPPKVDRVLIGRPVDNTRIYLLDENRTPVPLGATGELYIGGAGVTLGYHGRPELTAERFLADPFVPGGRMYRTGDLGRYLASGELECLGRNDQQVKLRGFRIELGEIEDALAKHPAVEQAAVILREDRPGDTRLVGYVVPAGGPVATGDLRAHLKRTLPEYMVPASYVSLARMPLTPSGKVDRRALPAPEPGEADAQRDFVEPRTEMERLLAELWASTLGVARVSVEDDFFALGGHSLLASQILGRLRRDHGIELSFRKFFEAPTIARLAEAIAGHAQAQAQAARRIERRARGAEAPLSVSQERLYLLEEMHPAQRVVHNLPAAWAFTGNLELSRLQQALDHVVARQELLRTRVELVNGHRVQRVDGPKTIPIVELDLRSLPQAEREPEMMRRIQAASAEPFDLAMAPLFRSILFRLEDTRSVYYTLRHNLIWDGWSFDVFLRDLAAAYGALERGEPLPSAELPLSYGDYAAWQREWVKGPELQRQIGWWQQALGDGPPDLALPLDKPRRPQPTYAGANMALKIPRADAEGLAQLARSSGTTLFTILSAAFSILLQRFSDQNEILVGTPVRARALPELEDIIGPFINTVVLRLRPNPELTFGDYVKQVRDVTLDAVSNEDMPLEMLGARPPALRAFFSFQDARERPVALGSLSVRQVDVEPPAAANDLMLWMMERPEELIAVANYSTDVFERETVEVMLTSFVTLLHSIVTTPERKLGELELEDDASPPTAPAGTPDSLVHELFAQTVERTPQSSAYVDADGPTSFETLSRRSQIVTGTLVARGVQPGSRVGVLVPLSGDLLLAALAVWRAGGAVLALDPDAPAAFNELLCARANVSLVLTTGALRDRATRPTALLDELAVTLSEPGVARADQPAWIQPRLDDSGEPVVHAWSHRDLTAAGRSVAAHLALSDQDSVLVASSLASETLPVVLLAAFAGAASVRFHNPDKADGVAPSTIFVAPPAELLPLAAAARSGKPRALLVDGPTLPGLEPAFALGVPVFTLQVVMGEHPVAFLGAPVNARDRRLLGTLLGSARSGIAQEKRRVPLGAWGNLVLVWSHERIEDLRLRARRRRNGQLELAAQAKLEPSKDGAALRPSAVARALEAHAAVARAVVRLEQTDAGLNALVAYVAAEPGAAFTQTELRKHLRSRLPARMVPSQFVELGSVPLLADGSVDFDKLPSPFGRARRDYHVEPSTPSQVLVARCWRDALKVPSVGLNDNFFDLGGHSLLCFQVLDRIERESGKRLSPRLFLLNTLEQVAHALDEEKVTATRQEEAPTGLAGRMRQRLEGLLGRR